MKVPPLSWAVFLGTVLAGEPRLISQTWSPSDLPPKTWLAIASSAEGSNIAALATQGLFTSRDSGQTWTTNTIAQLPWVGLASSADGSKLIAASGSPSSSKYSYVLTSTDFGISWTTSNVPNVQTSSESLTSVASSADGNTLVVVGSYGRIYISTNGNSSWLASANASYGFFSSVACSTTGERMAVVSRNVSNGASRIWLSTDWGLTWNITTAPSLYWTALAFSAEGAKLYAYGRNAAYVGSLYVTADDGVSWTQFGLPDPIALSFAVSADGNKLTVGSAGIFTSFDGGANWITNTSASLPSGGFKVASSADGGRLTAASYGSGLIYRSGSVQQPVISLDCGSGASKLSWVVPSSNFVLEQSADSTPWSWYSVTNVPSLNPSTLHHEITLPAVGTSRFFRLRAE